MASTAERPTYLKIDGKILKFTNLEKIFFPETGATKRDVLKYYRALAPTLLPHLRDRPFTLKRYPDGVRGQRFFEKQCPFHRPSWIRTAQFDRVNYCLINDVPSLLWAVNLGAIELHTTLAVFPMMQNPTYLAFDLDPGDGVGLRECCEVALRLKALLERFDLNAYPKTSGKKGLHVYAPLNSKERTGGRAPDYDVATAFCRWAAEELAAQSPSEVTPIMAKKLRAGKVFVDWSQNVDFKTTVTVYSMRAEETPGVSTPLKWKEVEAASKSDMAAAKLLISPEECLARVKVFGDLFEPVLNESQKLPLPRELPLRKRYLKVS